MFDKPRYSSDIKLEKAAFQAWLCENTDDKDHNRIHTINMMRIAIFEELTYKQKQYVMLYFVHKKSIPEISKICCVNKSTVSRTISRALKKMKRVLKYTNPFLLKLTLEGYDL